MKPICLVAFLLGLLGSSVSAQAPLPKARVALCDRNVIFVLTEGGAKWPELPSGEKYVIEIAKVPESPGETPVSMKTEGVRSEDDPTFLRAEFQQAIPAGVDLKVKVRRAGDQEVAEGLASTKAKASIQYSGAEAEAHFRFEVLSATPLPRAPEGSVHLVEVLQKTLLTEKGQIPEKTRIHPVDLPKQPPDPLVCDQPRISGGIAGGISGGRIVDLRPGDRLADGSAALRLVGLKDVFGQSVTAEGDLVPAAVPKGKDDALIFVKALFESAQGSPNAYSIDAKAQPVWQLRGRWLFRPELTAAVSKNVPKATNSIRFALLASRTWVRREDWFVANSVYLGPAVQADRNFDRVHVLADLRWQPDFKGLYHSRETQRIVLAVKNGKKLEEVALPWQGWGLDGWLGLEAGRSVRGQTVKNSAGTASLEIDLYDVVRLRPQIHGFYELGPVTLDVSSSLRYLFTTESAVDEKPDGTLSLREIRDFKPYTEATLSWAFDAAKHLSLAMTYKNGSEPPLFVKVEKLSIGVVAKY